MNSTESKVQELKNQALAHRQEAQDSFDRCDTDGFLSQWAHGLNSSKCTLQAEIESNNGRASFPALFDLDENLIRAKLIDGRFGNCWALMNEKDEFIGKFISAFPKRVSTMERKGYREGTIDAPAYAAIVGKGTGLSGHAWTAVLRKPGPFLEDVVITDTGK